MSDIQSPSAPPRLTPRGRLLIFTIGVPIIAAALLALPHLYSLPSPDDRPVGAIAILSAKLPTASANVVLILVDALRPDHLGCYGYGRDTSPNLDRFASSATLYARNKSQSSVTPISMAYILTGKLDAPSRVRRGCPTLAETLSAAGSRTICIQTNPWLGASLYSRGFDDFTALMPPGDYKAAMAGWHKMPDAKENCFYSDASAVVSTAVGKLSSLPPARRFFMYLHFMDAHEPLIPKPEFDVFSPEPLAFGGKLKLYADFIAACEAGDTAAADALKERVVALYDGEIREVDSAIGALLDGLRARGLYDDSVIVIASDHGELFGDHGLARHANGLYESHLRTPLIIKFPGQKTPSRYEGLSRNIDIAPTVLAAIGFSDADLAPFAFDGVPLQRVGPDAPEIAKAVLARDYPTKLRAFSVEKDGFKLIVEERPDSADAGKGTREVMLFQVAKDPGETVRLEKALPEKVEELAALLPLRKLGPSELADLTSGMTEDERARLKALGYLQ